jgi:large subunit ribosomal protein L10
MPNAEKTEKVTALKERIEGANALLLTEYRGLTVSDATELRRSLSEQGRFAVVKNTLMARAAVEAGIEDMESLLSGPTAVAFVDGDVVTAAKRVVDAAKKYPALVLKGAYLDGKVLSAADAQALATLESREVMLSKIAGLLKMEMTRAASMFQAVQSRFLGVLEAYKDKVPGGDVPAEPEAAPGAAAEAPSGEDAAVGDADEGQPAEESAEAPETDPTEAASTEPPADTAAADGDGSSEASPEDAGDAGHENDENQSESADADASEAAQTEEG